MTGAGKAMREPPMSPHLSVWRWHLTMASSILHRATGVALYAGALIAAAWVVALAMGPDSYAGFKGLLGSPVGKLVMLGLTVSFFYHLGSGVRHLVWDAGYGFQVKTSNASTVLILAFAAAATLAVWAIAAMTGAL